MPFYAVYKESKIRPG